MQNHGLPQGIDISCFPVSNCAGDIPRALNCFVMAAEASQSKVDKILSLADEERKSSFKSIEVFKEVEPVFDVGNLLISDQQPLVIKELR